MLKVRCTWGVWHLARLLINYCTNQLIRPGRKPLAGGGRNRPPLSSFFVSFSFLLKKEYCNQLFFSYDDVTTIIARSERVSEKIRRKTDPPKKGKKKETGSDEFRGAGGAAGGAMRSTHLECKAEAGIMGPPQSGRAAGSAPPLSVHH